MALVLVGVVHAVGMAVWPNYGNDDEGTYMARAWAVQTGLGAHHGPAPYTYWYDHPPFGWIQLSLWTWLTHTFRAGTIAVASGQRRHAALHPRLPRCLFTSWHGGWAARSRWLPVRCCYSG